ncbi:RagB/SusD family nutrient uptake outer membrane protein [Adhaeribacter swui]|uniref:RagB/SusD family nutrient uptake outer membrane protein n=1 Tax=Adhaeribacter swui TaxID=2086471 RepID=A0A7G7GES5_9BACT|nr:RagB/SusD family nutrient uptake outer membrane protein [Adhaeribacter swui]QNF35659.1 RagB/SusD family nutrient uptake outer membrane protein [Adhaeribacter swui]
MKKLTYIITLCFSLVWTACSDDFLDQPPLGNQTDENFYSSSDAGYKTLLNVYLGFYDFWGYQAARAELGNMATDDSDKGGSDAGDRPFVTDLGFGRALSNNETLQGFWAACYKAIGNSNIALEKLTVTPLLDAQGNPLAEEVKQRYLAEIRFLRAYFYLDLVRTFGGVPLITKTLLVEDRTSIKRATAEEVFAFIDEELTAVANEPNLPSSNAIPASELGRVTKEAVWALQARAYLFFAKDNKDLYPKAKDAAKKVIDSKAFALHPQYQEIFLQDGYKTKEAVFSIIMGDNPAAFIYGSTIPVYTSPRGTTGGWGFDVPTQDLVNEFEEGDPRLLYSVLSQGDIFPKSGSGQEVLDFSAYPNNGYHNRKVYLPESRRGQGWGNDAWTYHPIRYADVLLMYAEALIESGGDRQEAANYINMVRQRASNSRREDVEAIKRLIEIPNVPLAEVKVSDDLQKALRHERRVELALEYHRLYDLIRWGLLAKTMNEYSNKPGSNGKGANFKKGINEVFPIPQIEIERSGGSIVQNPGY